MPKPYALAQKQSGTQNNGGLNLSPLGPCRYPSHATILAISCPRAVLQNVDFQRQFQLRRFFRLCHHPNDLRASILIPYPINCVLLGRAHPFVWIRGCGSELGFIQHTISICVLIYDAFKSDNPVCPPQGSRDRSGGASPLQCPPSQSRQKPPAAASVPSQGFSCSRRCRRGGPPRNVRS